jgi:hypothetical protein
MRTCLQALRPGQTMFQQLQALERRASAPITAACTLSASQMTVCATLTLTPNSRLSCLSSGSLRNAHRKKTAANACCRRHAQVGVLRVPCAPRTASCLVSVLLSAKQALQISSPSQSDYCMCSQANALGSIGYSTLSM